MKLHGTYQTCRHLELGQHVPEAPGPLDQWQQEWLLFFGGFLKHCFHTLKLREGCLAVPARVHKLFGRFLWRTWYGEAPKNGTVVSDIFTLSFLLRFYFSICFGVCLLQVFFLILSRGWNHQFLEFHSFRHSRTAFLGQTTVPCRAELLKLLWCHTSAV